MPKKRHLLITIGGREKKQKTLLDNEIRYRQTTKKEKYLGEFHVGKKETLSKAGDGFAAAFLTTDFSDGATKNAIFLRGCLEWLVDGAEGNHLGDNDHSRKITLMCHGQGTTELENHADFSVQTYTIMSFICAASKTLYGSKPAYPAWDGNNAKCQGCGKTFSRFLVSGRHHCRVCGRSVCQKCCTKESVSFALESKGGAAAAASSPTSWVCFGCSAGGHQNLLSKVGVFRLIVCCGALRMTERKNPYVYSENLHKIRDLSAAERHKVQVFNPKLFPKNLECPTIRGNLPKTATPSDLMNVWGLLRTLRNKQGCLNIRKMITMQSGNPVLNFLDHTVAGTVVTVLRHHQIRGIKVTASRGIILQGCGIAPTVRVNEQPGDWDDLEYNPLDARTKQLYNLKNVRHYGSADEITFSKSKLFTIS